MQCYREYSPPTRTYTHECLWVSYDSLKTYLPGMNAYTVEIASIPTVPVTIQAKAMDVFTLRPADLKTHL